MKKTGILNPALMRALTALGHTDRFIICDAGFPIPKGVECIDLTLIAGVPSFMDCLNAVLAEVVVEEIALAKEMIEINPESHDRLRALFKNQPCNYVAQEELLKASHDVKFIIRSADFNAYSNIMLTSASGVEKYYKDFYI